MKQFDEREQAFEKKYIHDQDTEFKVNARRNRLLGLWAAERMGKSLEEAEAFAKCVVKSDYQEKGDMDVFNKVFNALAEANVPVNETELRAKMNTLYDEAKKQFMEG